MAVLRRLAADRGASAATEMALSLPLLIVLLLGAVDMGYYFMSEHIVQKGVRDAARYGSRLSIAEFPACVPSATAQQQIQRVAKAGDPDGDWNNDGTQDKRIEGWTADTMTTVTVTCDSSGTYRGVFTDFPNGAPVMTVRASVPYPSLFGSLGIPVPTLTLNAQSQTAVFGA
jgi:Flp pilus assembly protein TadG